VHVKPFKLIDEAYSRRKNRWVLTSAILVAAATLAALLYKPMLSYGGLETPCTYVSDLVATNPLSSDLASTSDDHHRCIKTAVKGTFPNLNAAVTLTDENLNDAALKAGTNVFTAAGSGASSAIMLSSATPVLSLNETDAATANRLWDFVVSGESLLCRAAANDASSAGNWCAIDRTGTTVDTVNLLGTSIQTNGVSITATTTTATGTLTGCTTAPTTTVRWVRIGNIVTGHLDQQTCTSNTTAFTITGAVPSGYQPARTVDVAAVLSNNGSATLCPLEFANGSQTITGNCTFTGSGTKGISVPINFSYIAN
jgi:hypothetical protein